MPAFNAEQNIAARNGRISHLHMSYAITFFGNAIALVTMLAFGPTESFVGKLAVAGRSSEWSNHGGGRYCDTTNGYKAIWQQTG